MKPVFEKIYNPNDSSFNVMFLETQTFDHPFHYHPEYELTLITAGSGHRFVGDHTDTFFANDLVLLGKNLPHCWLDFGQSKHLVSAVVIQFADGCFGETFFQLPEMHPVQILLKKSGRGIQFHSLSEELINDLKLLPSLSGVPRLMKLLSILDQLSASTTFSVLSATEYSNVTHDAKFTRVDKVFSYVSEKFKTTIDLAEAAELVHMTPSAFCHYFKKYTRKTFTQYVNEVRIGYACKLLMETELNVSEVCFQSGYNSLSRFNKCFKKITHRTPLTYRKQFNLPLSKLDIRQKQA
jgi:AraC-like DNA-binding protein